MLKKTIRSLAAASLAVAAIASAGTARADWFECQPTEVFEFSGSRIHVKCANSITLNGNVIRFVTVSTANAALANRFTSIANAALLSQKTFVTNIPASSATNVAGCLAGDCRTTTVWGVKN